MPVEEPPMVTATEPGQVNWIPEPFLVLLIMCLEGKWE